MSWKPDETYWHPDGSREEIRWRREPGADGSRSRIRKVVGPDGMTREVWHEAFALDGTVIHQHLK